mmetsp:Transcript_3405/g.11150  ORF Transcript_3405/g.11150 Transcript_3405/m.11150 type:complete len:92 (-) Transcript_3405:45-320(-)
MGGCGEMYCCATCRSAHWDNGHALTCTGSLDDGHPLQELKLYVKNSHESFQVAVDIVAMIVSRARREGGKEEDFRKAALPFAALCAPSKPW